MTICIGIDPGISGAVAVSCSTRGLLEHSSLPICSSGGTDKAQIKNKVDARGLRTLLTRWSLRHKLTADPHILAVIERMSSFGAKDQVSPTVLLSMGHSAGVIEGVVGAFSHVTLQPLPQQWKKQFALSRDKSASIKEAQRRYPQIGRVTHDQAEAILLSLWGLGTVTAPASALYLEDDPMAMSA